MEQFINLLKNREKYIEDIISKNNNGYKQHYFCERFNNQNNKIIYLKSIDDCLFNFYKSTDNELIINNLIKDYSLESLLNSLTSVYPVFHDDKWIKFTENNFLCKLENNNKIFVNSINKEDINNVFFINFLNKLKSYETKFNFTIKEINLNDSDDEDDEDEDYSINITWLVILY